MPPVPPKKKVVDPYAPIKALTPNQQICCVRFSPDGNILAAGTFEGSIRRWDFSTDKFVEFPAIKSHLGWVQQLAFHPDNKRFFAADSFGQLIAWPNATADAKPLWSIKDAHNGWIHSLALSPDGTKIATASRDLTARISSTSDGKREAVFTHPHHVMSVAFHPDGKSIVTGDLMGIIRQWDLATGKSVREFDAKAMHIKDRLQDVGGVRCFLFDSKGGQLIAGGTAPATGAFVTGTTLMHIYDWQTGKLKHSLKGTGDRDGFVYDMVMHPDGYLLAVSSGQPGVGAVLFQKLDEAQPFATTKLPNCLSLALHPNGTRLVVASTNANSSGNGKPKTKNDEYPGNFSPLNLFDLPKKG